MADIPVRVIIDAIDNASSKLKGVGQGMDDLAGNMQKVGAVGIALGAGTLFLAKGFVEQAGAMEQNQIAFETMLGSATKAKTLLQEMSEFAARTPFNLPDIVNAGKQLLAYGFQQKEVIATTEMLGNVAAGLNIPIGDIIYLFGTLRAQGRAYTKDLNQFTARGIPILDQLAKQYGVTTSEVFKLTEQGKVGFADVEKAFEAMTGKGGLFFNLMDKQSKSTLGTWSNLQDSFTRTQIALGDALLPALNEVMRALMPMVAAFGKWAKENPELVKNIILASLALSALLTPLAIIGIVIPPILSAISLIGSAFGFLSVAITAVTPVLGGIIAFLSGPIGLAIVGVIALVTLLAFAWKNNWGDIQGKTKAAISTIVSGFHSFMDVLSSLGKYFLAVFDDGDYLNDWLSHLPNLLQGPISAIGRFIQIVRGLGLVVIDFFTGGDVTATWYQEFRTAFIGVAIFLDNFRNAVLTLPQTIAAFGVSIVAAFTSAFAFIGSVLTSAGAAIVAFFNAIPGAVQSAINSFGAFLYNYFTTTLPYAIGYAAGQIVAFFTVDIPAAWGMLVNFFTTSVPAFFAMLGSWFLNGVTIIWTGFVNFFTVQVPLFFMQLFTWFVAGFMLCFEVVSNFFMVQIPQAFTSLMAWLSVAVPALGNAIAGWFASMGQRAWAAVIALKDNTIAAYEALKTAAIAKSTELYNSVVSWFTKTQTDAGNAINALPGEVARIFESAKNTAISKAQELYNGVKGWYEKVIGWLKDIVDWAGSAINKANQAGQAGFNAGKARQFGGPVSTATGYTVGEAGSESFTPQTAGYITPHGDYAGKGRGMGGTTIQFIINAGTIVNSPNERRSFAEAIYKDLVTLARSQNMSVQELFGA